MHARQDGEPANLTRRRRRRGGGGGGRAAGRGLAAERRRSVRIEPDVSGEQRRDVRDGRGRRVGDGEPDERLRRLPRRRRRRPRRGRSAGGEPRRPRGASTQCRPDVSHRLGPLAHGERDPIPAPRCARVMSCCDMSACTCTPMPAATGVFASSVTRVASSHGACAPSPLQPGTGSRSGASASFGSSARSSPPPGVPGSAPAGESAPGRPSRPSREGAYPSPWPDFFFLFGIDDRRAGALWGGTGGGPSSSPVFSSRAHDTCAGAGDGKKKLTNNNDDPRRHKTHARRDDHGG